MVVTPNHQKLIIPGKNYRGINDPYATDMRTIEQWANEGIVRKLIAGSNITLLPASGIDAGQGIEISATGGGGAGPPVFSVGVVMLTAGWAVSGATQFELADEVLLLTANKNTSLTNNSTVHLGSSTVMKTGGGSTFVATLPMLYFPTFSAGTITVDCFITVTDTTLANAATWEALGVAGSSGTQVNTTATNYSLLASTGGAFALFTNSIEGTMGTLCLVEALIRVHYTGLVP